MLAVSALWLTDSWHGLDPAVPALFDAVLMVTPGIGVLSRTEVERGAGVGLVFVIAASLSLAHTVLATGAATWLGTWLVAGLQPCAGSPIVLGSPSLLVRPILTAPLEGTSQPSISLSVRDRTPWAPRLATISPNHSSSSLPRASHDN